MRVFSGLVSSVDKRSSLTPGVDDEESVSAIQKFLDSTDAAATSPPSKDGSLKVPPGVKITAAGRGVVNIRLGHPPFTNSFSNFSSSYL